MVVDTIEEDTLTTKTKRMRIIAIVTHTIVQLGIVGITAFIHMWMLLIQLVSPVAPTLLELAAMHAAGPAAALVLAFVFVYLPGDTRRVNAWAIGVTIVGWLIATVVIFFAY